MNKLRALLVGINDYPQYNKQDIDLGGCLNDVKDIANTLQVLGIVPSLSSAFVRILTDSRATRSNIEKGWTWLKSSPKDRGIFSFSGHGSRSIDLDKDEVDGFDETLCQYDFQTEGMITDDDIRNALGGTIPIEMIIDSCHSGTISRAPFDYKPDSTIRYIEPPLDSSMFINCNPFLKNYPLGTSDNIICWAACQDNQYSEEMSIGGVKRGLFTYAFMKVLRNSNRKFTRQNMGKAVTSYLSTSFKATQKPRLTCMEKDKLKRLFE